MNVPEKQNLYRKYRPAKFSQLAGQQHISHTIQSSVASGRISHAYMFSGPRGTGKTSSARLLAKILNCSSPELDANNLPDCCCKCENCQRIEEQKFMDIIEIDAASNNSVEDIRQMREKVKYKPAEGKYKIYIIDEVHMLSGAAFNAFLKTLEEPPANVIFVLATTDPQKVPATIISRCQGFDFHSVSRRVIKERLETIVSLERENSQDFPEFDSEALAMIAECAQGGFRDALSLLDQISSSSVGKKIELDQVLLMTRRLSYSTLKEISTGIFTRKPEAVVKTLNELYFNGYEPATIARDLLEHMRRCMLLKIDSQANQILDLPEEQVKEILEAIKELTLKFLLSTVTRIESSLMRLKNSFQARILLETELIRICLGEAIFAAEAVEERIEKLEQKVESLKRFPGGAAGAGRIVKTTIPGRRRVQEVSSRHQNVEQKAEQFESVSTNDPLDNFKAAVARNSRVCSALLVNARMKYRNNCLYILLEQEFALNKLREEKNQNIMLKAASEIFGSASTIKTGSKKDFMQNQADDLPKKKADHRQQVARIDEAARKKVLSKPAISDAIEVFGGEIIDLEK